MRLNADFDAMTIVHGGRLPWRQSPVVGVERRMVYREGEETARATTIVRYAPGSAFPRHVHGGGEEILVLEGVFQDEHGDYPAGAYFRNPPGTAHEPASGTGCTLFVRLWQFNRDDDIQTVRQPYEGAPGPLSSGVAESRTLFESADETVRLERWEAGAERILEDSRGLELLVVSGRLSTETDSLEAQAWLRLPAGVALSIVVGEEGAQIWLKRAPLIPASPCGLSEAS